MKWSGDVVQDYYRDTLQNAIKSLYRKSFCEVTV